ncbi:MAG TPA: TonB-dependent receptor [Caulobacteraceae bacterium]|nr:TonB-dependent receptor [Caulobacteraceae bacterium]
MSKHHLLLAGVSSLTMIAGLAHAQSAAPPATAPGEVVVTADRAGLLERRPSNTVFGLSKPLTETPRAASVVSAVTVERYGIQTVNDLVAVSPSTYTASFYGIPGSLDIRGNFADNYFQGFKLIENKGTYTTPLGDASQIDIVRGPPSPIYGPGKVGGFLNFVPKSAASESLTHPVGEIDFTYGSYDLYTVNGQVGAPAKFGVAEGGVYAYGEYSNGGSFYEGIHPEHELAEVSVDFSTPSQWTFTADGLIYGSSGDIQTPGWNRLTQALVDNGTYITGHNTTLMNTPGVPYLTPAQTVPSSAVIAFGAYPNIFTSNFAFTNSGGGLYYALPISEPLGDQRFVLNSPGAGTTVKLSPRDVDVGPLDFSNTLTGSLVMGLSKDFANDSTLKFQFFYDGLENKRYVSYGFPAWFRANTYEERVTYDFKWDGFDGLVKVNTIVGANDRYYQGRDMQSFNSGLIALDRRDLSVGATPTDTICDPFALGITGDQVPTNCQGWEEDIHSTENDAGIFGTTDVQIGKFDLILGGRYDWYNVASIDTGILSFDAPGRQSAAKGDGTYSVSASYKLPFGLLPYITYAQASSLEVQQAGDLKPADILSGGWLSHSDLIEGGVKFQLLNNTIVGSIDGYQQDRTLLAGFNSAALNTRATGGEVEIRYLATKNLSFTLSGDVQRTEVLGPDHSTDYVPAYAVCGQNLSCELNSWGGAFLVFDFSTLPGRSGSYKLSTIPDEVFSFYGNYITDEHDWGRAGLTVGVTYVSSTSGTVLNAITYPAYELVNASVFYEHGPYEVDLNIDNLLDRFYVTPNSDPTYSNVSAIPGVGREWRVTLKRRF